MLVVLTAYRFDRSGKRKAAASALVRSSAMGDLLGADFALAANDTLYRSLDRLLARKEELFRFLQGRWRDLFGVKFEVLLYDLPSAFHPNFRFSRSRSYASRCAEFILPKSGEPSARLGQGAASGEFVGAELWILSLADIGVARDNGFLRTSMVTRLVALAS